MHQLRREDRDELRKLSRDLGIQLIGEVLILWLVLWYLGAPAWAQMLGFFQLVGFANHTHQANRIAVFNHANVRAGREALMRLKRHVQGREAMREEFEEDQEEI